jgi:hypothetical protein
MKANITGTVHVVTPTEVVGQKSFRKRFIVLIEDNGRYQKHIPFLCVQDQCSELDDRGLKTGDQVKIQFELGGNEWDKGDGSEPRYFLEAKVIMWRVLEEAAAGPTDDFYKNEPVADQPF